MSLLREIQAAVLSDMRHLRLTLIWTALAFVLFAGNSKAEDVSNLVYPSEALAKLGEQSTGIALAAKEISSKWTFIESSFEKVGMPSEAFAQGMSVNTLLLKKAAAKPNDPVSAAIVEDVLNDLAIKTDYISSVKNISAAAYSQVEIEVRTKTKDGREVNGYFIGFSPKYKTGSDDPMFPFNNPTSPSSGTLPPGRYEMTANLNGQIVQRQQVSVGIQGQGNSITCVVP